MAKSTSGKTRAKQPSQRSAPAKKDAQAAQEDAPAASEDSKSTQPDQDNQADILDAIPSGEVPEEVIQLAMRYAGPLPPPGMLRQYNDALPDGAHRIVSAWETEGQHRRHLQNRGQWIAAILGGGAIIAAVVCALFGQPWVGGSIIAFTMLAMGATGAIGQVFSLTRKR